MQQTAGCHTCMRPVTCGDPGDGPKADRVSWPIVSIPGVGDGVSLDFSCGGFWGVLGWLGPMLAGLWGLIVLDGYDESAGVARWAGFPGPKGLSGRLNS